ncbi:thiosulfate sulfurtransferase GlpE [Alkalimarinus coralli]|uniref:thiosulfate sulfurtransferase GlpE n=1 Tax=Alkalimarinus coralli TaxID=2935863 RepID=UPI00202B64A8|nr:thiosulfate sulfurtransferase GlpE [Alkalimarinus coralli]
MPFKHMSVATLQSLLNEKPVTLIDIRDPASFAAGHIEGAQHIGNHNLEQFLAEADRSLPLVVCCYHGNSSQGAADYFNQQGFEESYSLDGGFTAWPAS